MKIINVAENFSEYPGLRHCSISDDSGEEFYHKILNSAFKEAVDKGAKLMLDLDNTAGYAPSFLDEALGNLVYDFTLENVTKHLEIISIQEPDLKTMLQNETFIEWEERRKRGNTPKITGVHSAWYRLVNGKLILDKWE
ncbi:STAS-like domain-containing protein [Gillisia sp. JM1]|uniref:STAS-like domain-containing protein n=1 Tax=Gillisia sp. JM1 TaxID=1283286 RepID=UPI00040C713A|nr:STAS-like domain-containing protein [Gillisia sp. JM1]